MVAKVLSYYGYAGQEQDLLQYVSKATRLCAKSYHAQHLKPALKVHRFAPYYDWPHEQLETDDIEMKIYSPHLVNMRNCILEAWNESEDLGMVV